MTLGFYLVGPGSYGHVPWPEGVARIAEAGFRSVDVSASKAERVLASDGFLLEERRFMRSLCDDHGVAIDAVVTHRGLIDALANGESLDLVGAIDVARDLGSPLVLVHIGLATNQEPTSWTDAVVAFRAAADHAAPYGIAVCLDALAPSFMTPDAQAVDRFLNEVERPNVGWNFDPGFVAAAGYPMAEVGSILGRWIRHVHVKDFRGRFPAMEWVVPGDGELVDAEWAEVLASIDFRGAVAAEVIARPPSGIPERWTLADAAERSYAALSRVWS